ncbi:hypothetical protein GCM10027051_11580 [Niabella terrae]
MMIAYKIAAIRLPINKTGRATSTGQLIPFIELSTNTKSIADTIKLPVSFIINVRFQKAKNVM